VTFRTSNVASIDRYVRARRIAAGSSLFHRAYKTLETAQTRPSRSTRIRSRRAITRASAIRYHGVSAVRFRTQVSPTYCGSRLLTCLMLSIGVAAFFLIYDRMMHPGMASLLDSPEPRTVLARPIHISGYGTFNESPAPDMNSAEVRFANADVTRESDVTASRTVEPRKPQPKQKALKAKGQSANHLRLAKIKGRPQGRAAYAQSDPGRAHRAISRL